MSMGKPVQFDSGTLTLASDPETFTVYTGNSNRRTRFHSVLGTYTGTVSGVTMQLQANGEPVAPAVGGLTTAKPVSLLPAGTTISISEDDVLEVVIAGGTASDTAVVEGHAEEFVG